jgi:hypothetical protein
MPVKDYIGHGSRKSKQFSGLLSRNLWVKTSTCTVDDEIGKLKDVKAYKVSKYVSCPFPRKSNRSYHNTLDSVLLLGAHLQKIRNGGGKY